jgi:thiamine-phosphate pyrophosphorylase
MQELPRIWIITNPDHPRGLVEPIAKALDNCRPGIVGVQLRAKRAPDRTLVAWGRELRSITRRAGAALTVNRRVDVAAIVEADGVHLPERGLRPTEVRAHWPAFSLLGVSRHNSAGLHEAARDSANFARVTKAMSRV